MQQFIRMIVLVICLSYPSASSAGLLSMYQQYQGYKHSKSKTSHSVLEIERHFLNRHSTLRNLKADQKMLTPEHGKKHIEKVNELSKLKEDECKRLHFEYFLRHPPGTKPEALKGSHGCWLWKEDAQYHALHPGALTLFGRTYNLALF